jgi:hypothetical protein
MKTSFFIQMYRDAGIPQHQAVNEFMANGVLAIFITLVKN